MSQQMSLYNLVLLLLPLSISFSASAANQSPEEYFYHHRPPPLSNFNKIFTFSSTVPKSSAVLQI
jgi:hypothetical protein